MQRGNELYSGKAKSVFECAQDDALILYFRNDTSAFDGEKIEQLDRKGMVNNKFNAFIMQHLESEGVATHFFGVIVRQRITGAQIGYVSNRMCGSQYSDWLNLQTPWCLRWGELSAPNL